MGVWLPHHCWSGSRGYNCSCLAVAWSFGKKEKDFLLLSFLSLSIVTQFCTHSKRYAAKTYQGNSRLCHTSYILAFTTRVAFLSPSFYNILVVLHVDIEQFWLLFMYIAYVKLDSLCLWKSMSTTFCIVFVLSFFSSFYIPVASPLLIWKPTKSHVWKRKTEEKRTALALKSGATHKWKLSVFLIISKVIAIFFFPFHKHHPLFSG